VPKNNGNRKDKFAAMLAQAREQKKRHADDDVEKLEKWKSHAVA
jgi:hypothetical protein